MIKNIIAAVILSLMVTGCVGAGYTVSDSNSYSVLKEGRIINVRRVLLKDNGLGTIGGALIGGLLGNRIGSGTGNKLATASGAILGGVAGNQINQKEGSEIKIRLNDGTLIKAVLDNYYYRVGDRVTVEFRNGKIGK